MSWSLCLSLFVSLCLYLLLCMIGMVESMGGDGPKTQSRHADASNSRPRPFWLHCVTYFRYRHVHCPTLILDPFWASRMLIYSTYVLIHLWYWLVILAIYVCLVSLWSTRKHDALTSYFFPLFTWAKFFQITISYLYCFTLLISFSLPDS